MIDDVTHSKKANLIQRDDITQYKEIGHGQFGAVYSAMYQGNQIVVKELASADADADADGYAEDEMSAMPMSDLFSVIAKKKKEQLARQKEMTAEIVLASSLPEHKNLVQIYGYLKRPFGVVMNFMRGGSVEEFAYRERLQNRNIPGVLEVLIILKKAASVSSSFTSTASFIAISRAG